MNESEAKNIDDFKFFAINFILNISNLFISSS